MKGPTLSILEIDGVGYVKVTPFEKSRDEGVNDQNLEGETCLRDRDSKESQS